jgi:hypothetical protein
LEKFPFCPADAAIVANIPLADIGMIYRQHLTPKVHTCYSRENPPFHISPLLYFSGQWDFEGASCSKILLARKFVP